MKRLPIFLSIFALTLSLFWATIAVTAAPSQYMPKNISASTIIVTTLVDEDNGCDVNCSLREAIATAIAGDTITFDAGLADGTITLSSGLVISKNVTISGTVPITISGNNSVRVFDVQDGINATFDSLTIANGEATDCDFAPESCGGGVRIKGNAVVTITNSTLTSNTADYGGGIHNIGVLNMSDSTLSANLANFDGGGIYRGVGNKRAIWGNMLNTR